jgi:hypothetical protein
MLLANVAQLSPFFGLNAVNMKQFMDDSSSSSSSQSSSSSSSSLFNPMSYFQQSLIGGNQSGASLLNMSAGNAGLNSFMTKSSTQQQQFDQQTVQAAAAMAMLSRPSPLDSLYAAAMFASAMSQTTPTSQTTSNQLSMLTGMGMGFNPMILAGLQQQQQQQQQVSNVNNFNSGPELKSRMNMAELNAATHAALLASAQQQQQQQNQYQYEQFQSQLQQFHLQFQQQQNNK